MKPAQRKRIKAFGMEAAGIFGFVMVGGLATIYAEHPAMPVMESWLKNFPLLRRIPIGLALGIYVTLASHLFSKASGAHFNPAVTWTFFRLGTIKLKDTLCYIAAQFAGATAAAFLLKFTLNKWFSHPNIDFGITKPLEPYTSIHAFIAETIISFIIMWVILVSSSYKRLEKKLPEMVGVLIAIFVIVEAPYSGMSMNPARSFAGAAAAGKWNHLWIYFAAPLFAMLVAAECYLLWKRKRITVHITAPKGSKDDWQRLKDQPAA